MAIAIDYFLKRELSEDEDLKILTLAVADEDTTVKMFNNEEIDAVAEFLAMRTRIVMYDNTIRNIYPYITREFIEDNELNKKVFDMFNYLKKETGHNISLSQLALATLGIDMELTRLPRNYDDSSTFDIQEKLETRVTYLQKLWNYGVLNGYLAYYVRGIRKTVEVYFNDSYDS